MSSRTATKGDNGSASSTRQEKTFSQIDRYILVCSGCCCCFDISCFGFFGHTQQLDECAEFKGPEHCPLFQPALPGRVRVLSQCSQYSGEVEIFCSCLLVAPSRAFCDHHSRQTRDLGVTFFLKLGNKGKEGDPFSQKMEREKKNLIRHIFFFRTCALGFDSRRSKIGK